MFDTPCESVEYSADYPWRPADWRSRRAASLECRPGDEWVRRVRKFRKADENPRVDQVLSGAHTIHRDRWSRGEIEAWILAGASVDFISGQVRYSRDELLAYEAVFFDARSRLADSFWIRHSLLDTARHQALRWNEVELFWRRTAFRFGSAALAPLLAGAGRDDLTRSGLDAYLQWESSLPLTLRGMILFARLEITPEFARSAAFSELLMRLDLEPIPLAAPEPKVEEWKFTAELQPIRSRSEWEDLLRAPFIQIKGFQLAL